MSIIFQAHVDDSQFQRWMSARLLRSIPVMDVAVSNPKRNEVIAWAQMKAGRDPFFVTPYEMRSHEEIVSIGLQSFLRTGSTEELIRRLYQAANNLAHAVKAHIYQRKTSGGNALTGGEQTRPLSPKYAEWKKKQVARGKALSVVPELIATGKFVNSIKGRVTRRK